MWYFSWVTNSNHCYKVPHSCQILFVMHFLEVSEQICCSNKNVRKNVVCILYIVVKDYFVSVVKRAKWKNDWLCYDILCICFAYRFGRMCESNFTLSNSGDSEYTHLALISFHILYGQLRMPNDHHNHTHTHSDSTEPGHFNVVIRRWKENDSKIKNWWTNRQQCCYAFKYTSSKNLPKQEQ